MVVVSVREQHNFKQDNIVINLLAAGLMKRPLIGVGYTGGSKYAYF